MSVGSGDSSMDIYSLHPDISNDFVLQNIKEVHKDVEQVTTFKLSPGSSLGDNFTSVMVAIDADVVKTDGSQDTINLMVKKYPFSPMRQQVFEEINIFEKEIAFYTTICDDMKKAQLKLGVEPIPLAIPQFYKGESNLGNKNYLAMENLKAIGYTLVDRVEGCSYEQAKLAVKELALYHASSMLLKLNGPITETYSNLIVDFFGDGKNQGMRNMFEAMFVVTLKVLRTHLNDLSQIHRLERYKGTAVDTLWSLKKPMNLQFATLLHGDCHFSNMMFRHEEKDGQLLPVEVRLVDWQVLGYHSICQDLSTYLYTSLNSQIRKEHLQDLLELYYNTLIQTLKSMKQDTSQLTFESFHEEWHNLRLFGYLLMVTWTLMVRAPREKLVDHDKFSKEVVKDPAMLADQLSAYGTNVHPKCIDLLVSIYHEGIEENII